MGTKLISVRVPTDVAKRLATLAETTDRSTSYVAAQAIEEFLTLQEWQVKAIRQGLAEAEAGKLESWWITSKLRNVSENGDGVERNQAIFVQACFP